MISIGRLAMAWGHLEMGLDTVLHAMHYGLDRKLSERLPHSLRDKVALFKRHLNDLENVSNRDEWLHLAGTIKTEAKLRGWVIHGAVRRMDTEALTAEFGKYDLAHRQQFPILKSVSQNEIEASIAKVRRAAGAMIELAKQCQRLAGEQNPQYLAQGRLAAARRRDRPPKRRSS